MHCNGYIQGYKFAEWWDPVVARLCLTHLLTDYDANKIACQKVPSAHYRTEKLFS